MKQSIMKTRHLMFGGAGFLILTILYIKMNFSSNKGATVPQTNIATSISSQRTTDDIVARSTAANSTDGKMAGTALQEPWTHLKTRFPKYFIIGFAKTGTKALYETLKMHPLLVGPMKEERFFTDHYKDGIRKYLESIPQPSPEQYTIEKSPDYVTSVQAPRLLRDAAISLGINPSHLTFVIVIRNPVVRSVSDYIELRIYAQKSAKQRPPPFIEEVLEQGSINSHLMYINHSCYAYHIKNWLKYFNKSQICFVDGDEFVTAPHLVVASLERCMGIRSFFSADNFVYNHNKGFYCLHDKSWSRPRCLGAGKGRPHPHIPPDILLKVRAHFQSCNDELYSIIGKDLNWNASTKY